MSTTLIVIVVAVLALIAIVAATSRRGPRVTHIETHREKDGDDA